LVNVEIINNVATSSFSWGGGGIYCEGNSNVVFNNVVISGNSSNYHGGGIYCIDNSNINMVNVAIIDNDAANNGGGVYLASHTNAVLENVLISGNFTGSRGRGGGIFSSYYTDLSLTNATMTNNRARDGGGINFGDNSNLTITNSILWNESEVQVYSGLNVFPCSVTVSYTDMLDGEAGIYIRGSGVTVNWLDGNINSDPMFDALPNPPFLLSAGSPCINAGHPASIYNDPEDPSNPGYALWPAMGTIRNDMGAYGGPNAAPFSIVVGVKDRKNEDVQIPTDPFNPTTTIQYAIKERSSVELILYDILGRQVKILLNEEQDAGYYKINFNAGRLASGIYFYRLQAGNYVDIKKMVLLK
jgi:predicted outer membrane repeat protein